MQQSCACVGISRAAIYRVSKPASERDGDVIDALIKTMERHPRWGFWKSFKALRRKGHWWNHKRVYRVYCDLRLNLKRRAKKRLPKGIKAAPLGATAKVWPADFMTDTLYCGKTFRTFIDDFNRECLNVEIDTSITGRRSIRELSGYGKRVDSLTCCG